MRPLLASVSLAVLSTCAVESTQPLSPPQKASVDKALLGRWVGTATDKTNLEVVIVAGTAGQMTVTMPARGDKEANAFEGHVTVLGSLRILNLRLVEGGKVGSHYIFVRYAVTADGALEVWLLREESVKQAIVSGKLKGRRDQYGSTTLDDTAENMSAWLRGQKPEVVFEKFATFVKK